MQNVATYNDDDTLLDTLTFLAIQGYLCFKRHFLQCYLHDIFTALWQQSMKPSADIKFNFYSVKIPLIHLIICSWWSWWYFYLHAMEISPFIQWHTSRIKITLLVQQWYPINIPQLYRSVLIHVRNRQIGMRQLASHILIAHRIRCAIYLVIWAWMPLKQHILSKVKNSYFLDQP